MILPISSKNSETDHDVTWADVNLQATGVASRPGKFGTCSLTGRGDLDVPLHSSVTSTRQQKLK